MLTLLLTLAAAIPPPATSAASAAAAIAADHGRLDWFGGSFDELLARARAEQRIVFLDFWAEWCGWCKRLDQDVFSERLVVDEMQPLLCYAIDKDSAAGGAIAARYNVRDLPTLIFLAPDGELLDTLIGYEPADEFLADVQRIKRGEGTLPALRKRMAEHPDELFTAFELAQKLRDAGSLEAASALMDELRARILRGEGHDRDSLDDQWRLVQAFRACGDVDAAERHMQRIEELDPERRSLLLRKVDLERVREQAEQGYARTGRLDVAPLEAFLADERHATLRFEGWLHARRFHGHLADEERKHGTPAAEAAHRADVRRAERAAWRDVPPELVAAFGHDLAWSWYLADDLDAEQRAFAVDVARRASEAAPTSVKHLDTLACCLDAAGRSDEALAVLERALALEPGNAQLIERRAELAR